MCANRMRYLDFINSFDLLEFCDFVAVKVHLESCNFIYPDVRRHSTDAWLLFEHNTIFLFNVCVFMRLQLVIITFYHFIVHHYFRANQSISTPVNRVHTYRLCTCIYHVVLLLSMLHREYDAKQKRCILRNSACIACGRLYCFDALTMVLLLLFDFTYWLCVDFNWFSVCLNLHSILVNQSIVSLNVHLIL